MARVREQEAAQRDTAPEAGCDVADALGRGVAVGDEEGDDPAGDGDFGALVGEDEEGAEDGGFVPEGLFQEDGFAGFAGWVGGAAVGWGGRAWGVGFEGAEGEVGEGDVGDGYGQGDGVEG